MLELRFRYKVTCALFMAMGSVAPAFPVPHKKLSLDIKGNKTDIVICSYDDHFLVIATQIGSMGTILHASSSGSSRSLVLSLGLKDHSAETLRGIASAVIEDRVW